jgi:hypothetical protein
MRGRKIVTARHCRRDPACAYLAIRDGWGQTRVNKAAELDVGGGLAGLKRAVAQGVKLGRPRIDSATERKVRKQLANGVGILKVARSLGVWTEN